MNLKNKSQKKRGKCPINMSKILNNINHQIHTNQNYVEISPHPSE
jgi:hypothetical protein